MANFSNNAMTEHGRLLFADVQAGAVFIPTRIVMGSGNMPAGSTPATMTDVVTPVRELTINKIEKTTDGKCIIGGVFSNQGISQKNNSPRCETYSTIIFSASALRRLNS